MKTRDTVVASGLLLMALASSASADARNAAARKAIQANYDKISAAFQAGNTSSVAGLFTPDATLTTPDHKTWDRERILSDMQRQSKMMKNASWKRNIMTVRLHGDQAVAQVAGRFTGTFNRDGKNHVFDLKSFTIDTWVKQGGDWKLKHAETQRLDATIDGKSPTAGAGGGHA